MPQLPDAGALDDLATARGTKDTIFTVSGYGLTRRAQEHSALPNISFRERPMSDLVVAVTPFGLNALCRATDFADRIDQPDVLARIRTFG